MTEQEAKFRSHLASQGLRMTPERQVVLDGALNAQGHFTADTLYVHLKRQHPRVSRATVYRTLELLVRSGLVERVDLGGQQAYYEYVFGREHHDHLICLGCGTIIEFTSPAIEDLQRTVCREHQFEIRHHSHKIFGRCQKCRDGSPAGRPGEDS